MHHRGPDASGRYQHVFRTDRHVTLLHSRLSIIDLDERANQPMRSADAALVYNGELYNYREIRRRHGMRLRTSSDTEVMLHQLLSRGVDGLDECEGMWAFALYRESDGSLMLCRDRFGEKPLYVLREGEDVYFASEIKMIHAMRGGTLAVDHDHLYRYLVNGYKALYKQPHSFFAGIEELPPATIRRFEADGSEAVSRYWTPNFETDQSLTYEDAVDGARNALVRAVELRLRADVPAAFLMSGGVDSNAIISIARHVFDHDVHGFTIVNTDARYDERDLVDHAVRSLAIRHTTVPVETADFLPRLRRLVAQHDAPVYTITYYAQWRLMQAIADAGYRVTISGTAADELFSGYYDHHVAYLYEMRDDTERHRSACAEWDEHIRPVVRNPWLSDPDLFMRDPAFRDHIFLDADHFAGYLAHPWSEPFDESRYRPGLLRNRMLNELFHEAVPAILHEDDLNAMSRSIENRSPFLDRDLFEACQRIPTRHLVQDGFAKAVLRDAVRGLAPDPVLEERRKVGFNAPIGDYLDLEDNTVREVVLDRSPIFDHVCRERIEELIGTPDLPNSRSKFLFYFLNAKLFLEEFAA